MTVVQMLALLEVERGRPSVTPSRPFARGGNGSPTASSRERLRSTSSAAHAGETPSRLSQQTTAHEISPHHSTVRDAGDILSA